MAIKKSELYSSLWASCDELRGGMDASQYKDYVLVFLFLKYISDKYAGQPFAPISIPAGASFSDLSALKGNKDIGDQINKAIIAPLVAANQQLSLSDFPDFNDASKLGTGKEMVTTLTNLIAIFERRELDFSKNRAEGDDILGDAYEFLMRHFATESGKSKGQFYTPAEVSRIMAKVLGIGAAQTSADTTVYDPTCGSGSLLLKVADEATTAVTLYGQEKDATTSGLARMNMILHDNPTAEIAQGNTLANPKFHDGSSLKTFDFVVANPPFSDKRWSNGVQTTEDPYERFKHFGTPPDKQGDYAYLLHILRSLKSTGKGACILPHGVLFRGNAEAEIRKNLIRKGYLKAIIGLPANLFYGTGIPACILVLDKADAHARKGIFMVDASNGFIKDGNKNRLRSRDLHQIVDAYSKGVEVSGYARAVSFEEIEKNDFNLNLPRYIDNRAAEDLQDIEAHLQGGIPARDVDALEKYWAVCPNLRASLFKPLREGYVALNSEERSVNGEISDNSPVTTLNSELQAHPDLIAFNENAKAHFNAWKSKTAAELKRLTQGAQPKAIIEQHSEALLAHYKGQPLIDYYAVYQHIMDYWAETMQDDVYLIAIDGWKAETQRILETNKKTGKTKDKGWTCDLVPKSLIVARYFAAEQSALDAQQAELESLTAQRTELEEEHSGEDGAFADLEKINKAEVSKQLKALKGDSARADEAAILKQWTESNTAEAALKKAIKAAEDALDVLAYDKYPQLSEDEIKTLVVDDKWLATLDTAIHGELDRISQTLTQRVKALAERYSAPLPKMTERVSDLETKVNAHLKKMGFVCN
ncbi:MULTISPECIES: type I restriction-modification system subunit M [unclassified Lentimonas]|uniref:type I restriction-modification system subunit M n=1 Tax=unclassified Lentimonas TaxID=2630993 RepID=UPI00132A6819|nr:MULTISPECIES: type I restriction-modification system subunit M [unclassified Lentimonas]CAA6689990.1 Type I restriction-modification system, DNA-methyltransferase subunit M (EC [Lentimonas sp. CC10]CAA6691065.1 Type I restriction-modification system, DNA-methyltransferase subunit M (EC [Lentimonas sp. CC19]CAA7069321.1 Type I restriction-modification system, DNA-methyltransferase subunit M (EC [Lentimonas sp. CC11]